MVRVKRRRRAAEGDLYAGCRRGQDCPDDIKPKFEQDTWADRFLKWFSSIIYLGNLGISTGRGAGGSTGYVPVGSGGGRGVRPAMGGQPSRPNVVVENVGPAEVPVDGAVDASAPSVITPSESTVVVGGSTTPHEEIPLVPLHPEVGPDPEPGLPLPPPESGGPAVLDVTLNVTSTYTHDPSIIHPRVSSLGESAGAEAPLFPTISLQPLDVSLLPGESSFQPHAYIDLSGSFEEIELDAFTSGPQDPQTSTPMSRVDSGLRSVRRAYSRRTGALRRLYHRLTQQVRVNRPEFLRRPSQLVSYVFDNAAFDPDTTLHFPQASEDVLQAPDLDFQDVGTLHRPIYSTEGGYVRVSRFGERETIRTRSGAAIGARVHFYTDLSSIQSFAEQLPSVGSLGPDVADPGIELHLFGEGTGDTSIADAQGGGVSLSNGTLHTETEFTNASNGSLHSEYSNSMLLDSYTETFNDAQLALMDSEGSTQVLSIPELARPVRGFAESTGGLSVSYPVDMEISGSSTSFIHNIPGPPSILLFYPDSSPSFYLHPSLLRRKRKRVFY
ncbi:L2 protein [Omikronpapillomavirus 1]|uniref:Minor capsid protein L2 n=1 Tax=Phocoena spinipinnis papillomavirus (isolate Burmeister's porpoise/Peru/PsPV1) TaxID=654916 RepID=Q8UZ13_PSPVP|nr:L2 protein [Omikronpapillomavirus 1]CAC80275.1 L2 protein [Omikronpapillomavirus 1]